jgi:hypothetical protein
MIHEASSAAGEVVLVLDSGTEAGYRLARNCCATDIASR